jgi:RNA polymerase sigma factor FliA
MTRRAHDTWEPYRPPAAPADAGSAAAQGTGPSAAADDEATLWTRATVEDDARARALLAERYMSYATAIAARLFARRSQRELEFDDYRQLAMVGLMEAIQRFEPGRGAKFTTFATLRIRGAIFNGLEQLSERQQQIAFRRRVAADRAESLTPERLAQEPGRQLLEDLQEIGVGVALGFILEGTGMIEPGPHAMAGDAYASLELRRLHEHLWELVAQLPERERDLLERHYRAGVPFEEIARELQLTKGRISQLHKQAVLRLRALASKAEACDAVY